MLAEFNGSDARFRPHRSHLRWDGKHFHNEKTFPLYVVFARARSKMLNLC